MICDLFAGLAYGAAAAPAESAGQRLAIDRVVCDSFIDPHGLS
jgi:hypothetical protein